MVFVNVYEVDRCYGGPEEGGWWYDAGTLVESAEVPAGEAEEVAAELAEQYPHTGKVGSVLYQGGDYRIRVEDEPGADYPVEAPHYE